MKYDYVADLKARVAERDRILAEQKGEKERQKFILSIRVGTDRNLLVKSTIDDFETMYVHGEFKEIGYNSYAEILESIESRMKELGLEFDSEFVMTRMRIYVHGIGLSVKVTGLQNCI